jgi:hypothetical protein
MNYYERVLRRINESNWFSKYQNSNANFILEVHEPFIGGCEPPSILRFIGERIVEFDGVVVPLSKQEVEQLYDNANTKFNCQQLLRDAKTLERL